MKINFISKTELHSLVYDNTDEFMRMINTPEVFIVKDFISRDYVMNLRNKDFELGQKNPTSWHPLTDDCVDYHRLHDNYPKAYVKQKFHGFYHHSFISSNKVLFNEFEYIFNIKCFLGGFPAGSFLNNVPSDGIVARINLHHYPLGGGYQSEHIDPHGKFASIQTLVIASSYGEDFKTGGVYARSSTKSEKVYLDSYTDVGDLLILSPAIPHGVEVIDSSKEYSPDTNDGRWVILPLYLYSDYEHSENVKPKQVDK